MMMQLQLLSLFLIPSLASALTSPNRVVVSSRMTRTALFSESESNPCWQDIYDADCTMDSFSARFVASDWIKKLPCGQGIEDCDFPEDTQLPGIRPESHQDINVMDFLNIKRVQDVNAKKP